MPEAYSYLVLRGLHIGAVVTSISMFALRGAWMLWSPSQLDRQWVRVVPHIVDTILLLSAIALCVRIEQYPLDQGWLTAKVVALLGYIVLGSVALKRGPSKRIRAMAFAGALATVGYIVLVARAHSAWPF